MLARTAVLAFVMLVPCIFTAKAAPPFSDANWISLDFGAGNSGVLGQVNAAVVDGSGNLFIGGSFDFVGNVLAHNIARWDGKRWWPLDSGTDGPVHALAVSGSDVYVGGDFRMTGGRPAYCIAKWDGCRWTALDAGLLGTVFALAPSGSDLYAGGAFGATGQGDAANYIAKWNGTRWLPVGSGSSGGGMNDFVYTLKTTASGNNLYAGGRFTRVNAGRLGNPANHIARWDGNQWWNLQGGVDGFVLALEVSGNDVYAGGEFMTAGGMPANHIAKWNDSGSFWTAGLGAGLGGTVRSLAVLGTDVYAGGLFTTAGTVAAGSIAKWNGSSWSALGSGVVAWVPPPNLGPPTVNTLTSSGLELFAGGNFYRAGGKVSANLARAWLGPFTPPVIAEHPQSQCVANWSTVTFRVNDAGGVSYQWRHNGQNLPAFGPILTIASVGWFDAGSYDVVVSNPFGSVVSGLAQLTVGLAMNNPSFEANTFSMWPGYVKDNGPVSGWSALSEHGVNPIAGGASPFADNGLVPDGSNVAFLQQDGAISQQVNGFSTLR